MKKKRDKKSRKEEKKRMRKAKKESVKEREKEIKAVKKEEKLKKKNKGSAHYQGLRKKIFISFIVSLVISALTYWFSKNITNSVISFGGVALMLSAYFVIKQKMSKYSNIKKMEDIFPDFISLMASNLRAGITVDRAILLSSRKEFAPLDKEILNLGKDIVTGSEISKALTNMSERIDSDEIHKTILLIISGIRSGGNLSVLLQETASNMRERNFVRQKAASNVLMYVIFVFFAVAIGAPVLFGLSSVLVEILSKLLSDIPTSQTSVNLPFTLTQVNISTSFIFYFSLTFVVVISILASLVLGLVSKGVEREGLKYMLPLILLSVSSFLISRTILLSYFSRFLF